MITTAVMAIIEKQLNTLLSLDSESQKSLGHWFGSTILCRSTTPKTQLYIHIEQVGVRLAGHCDVEPDLTIEGAIPALTHAAITRQLFAPDSSSLRIEGDEKLQQELHKLFSELQIDWSRPLCKDLSKDLCKDLCKEFGESASGFFESVTDTVKSGAKSVKDQVDDYLQHEQQVFPTRRHFDALLDKMDDLAARLARIEDAVSSQYSKKS